MVTPSVGAVVLVSFPFSDLSASKLRPAFVLTGGQRDDWLLCQITSNPYADSDAIEIADADFDQGSLRRISYACPGKPWIDRNAVRMRGSSANGRRCRTEEGDTGTMSLVAWAGLPATSRRWMRRKRPSGSVRRFSTSTDGLSRPTRSTPGTGAINA
jgi:hypothetical protein